MTTHPITDTTETSADLRRLRILEALSQRRAALSAKLAALIERLSAPPDPSDVDLVEEGEDDEL